MEKQQIEKTSEPVIIEVKDLSIDFKVERGVLRACNHTTFSIYRNETLAIIGESGSGKSTLCSGILNMVNVPGKVTSGSVTYFSEYQHAKVDILKMRPSRRQNSALNLNRTIFQSLSLPLLHNRIAKNSRETEKILGEYFMEVGLTPPEQFLYKYPHQLSGGQRQRILLARALSVRPELIVADEPVSMVDVSLRIALIDLMTRMNQKYNISFVYVTHDLATARYVAKDGRLAVMYLGKIVELNNIREAIDNPKHPYFQALIAAVPSHFGLGRSEMKDLPLRSLDMPSVNNPPSGCSFHTRCPYYKELCEKESPELWDFKGWKIACHYAEEIGPGRTSA